VENPRNLSPNFLDNRKGQWLCLIRDRGFEWDRLHEIDAVAPPLVPFLYPDSVQRMRLRRGTRRYAFGVKPPRIPRERWPEVVKRARCESLRSIARDFGVSHETVRAVLQSANR
jgi:hypothetical protein